MSNHSVILMTRNCILRHKKCHVVERLNLSSKTSDLCRRKTTDDLKDAVQ